MIGVDDTTVSRLAWTLIHFVWQGFIVYGLFRGGEAALAGRRANIRYAFALGALSLMAACPLVTWHWLDDAGIAVTQRFVEEPQPASIAETTTVVAVADFDWRWPLLSLWLLGVVFFTGRLLLGLIGISRWQRCRRPLEPVWRDRVAQLCRRMEIPQFRRVFQSQSVGEAIAVGFFRPFVLIPSAWLAEMPVSVLEAVIAHELAHIRRGDLWINGLQRVLESILFYHPAVWWLSARVREEREMCCDERAAQAMGKQLDYARALEFVARRVSTNHALLTASFAGDEEMSVLRRVRNVLGIVPTTRQTVWWPTAAVMLALCGWVISSASADEERPPQEGDRPPVERPEQDRIEERRPDGPREGDRRPEGPRDGERRPDGPRDGDRRPEGPRDGARPPMGPRDGDRRPDGPRDGERRPDGPPDGERRPPMGPRDGDRRPDGPRDGERPPMGPRDGARPPFGPREREEDLRREVDRLRREIEELRRELARQRGDGFRPERDGERPPREGERGPDRPREAGPPRDGDRPLPPPREGDRPRDGERRPEGERRPPREGDGPPRERERPDAPREGERPQRPDGE